MLASSFLPAQGDKAIRSGDPAWRRRCDPRPHEARALPRADRRRPALRRARNPAPQWRPAHRYMHSNCRKRHRGQQRDPHSLAAQNIPFRRDPAGQPGHGSAVHNGGYLRAGADQHWLRNVTRFHGRRRTDRRLRTRDKPAGVLRSSTQIIRSRAPSAVLSSLRGHALVMMSAQRAVGAEQWPCRRGARGRRTVAPGK